MEYNGHIEQNTDKPKRGRPTTDRKGRLIQVRVNDDIYRFVCRSALTRDITDSEYIRSVLQEKLDEERARAKIRKAEMEEKRQKALEEMRRKGMLFFNNR